MGRTKGGSLSHRQRQCFEARQQQLTAKEIGRSLNISPHTVAMHWRLAKLKIEAERGSQAVQGAQAIVEWAPSERRAAAGFRYLAFAALRGCGRGSPANFPGFPAASFCVPNISELSDSVNTRILDTARRS